MPICKSGTAFVSFNYRDMDVALNNRRWLLASRPDEKMAVENFRFSEEEFQKPDLADRQILVRNRMFACAPTLRNWVNQEGKSYRASAQLEVPIVGMAGVDVIDSRHPDFPKGSRHILLSRWEDYSVIEPDKFATPTLPVAADLPFEKAMSIFGLNSMTAYFGITRIGRPARGETVVVSGAAGSTGSMAAQIARIIGARVIGIAGGKTKCDWLRDELGLDDAIDYKTEDVGARLAELCPDGVNVFYDNVGGEILQAVMDNIARKGRIAVCGQISAYDSDKLSQGPNDMMKLVYWSVRIEGFLLGDFVDDFDEARSSLEKWYAEGLLVNRTDLRNGIENLPASFLDLFSGRNEGTLLVSAD
ncbi:NADP-dependent oxidoreductase [Novosphingobium marinum]|nr:NADP-dependent oxidoreductase [Novosphingobium marinum]